MRSLSSGHLIGGRYRLEERLGEGALGVVYCTVHVGLEKRFAIKLLKVSVGSPPAVLERFRKEAVALGRLQHPNIVDVTDSGIDESAGGVPYIVTELLKGVSLSDRCRAPQALGLALPLLGQIAGAVDAAHDAGVLHRDLKPGNVFVCSKSPDSTSVKVLDFGLAELLAGPDNSNSGRLPGGEAKPTELTPTGSLLATPLYVAPELIRLGQASRSSDIYSFGVLAYELLGGKPPFRGTLEEVLAGHLDEEPPPLPLPPEVWRALRETLQKDPALRPRTAGEVVRRLLEGMAEAERACWKSIEIPRPRPIPRLRTICNRHSGSLDPRESARALMLMRLLEPGDGGFPYDLPGELFAELRRGLAAEYHQVHAGRRELRLEQAKLWELIWQASSRIEALEDPLFEFMEARAALAPETVVLSYSIGESKSFLYVIAAKGIPGLGLFFFSLATGKEELKREVEAFRNALDSPNANLSALKERGRHLYDLLVRPAEPVLANAKRCLISPDGPLHSLPFATLFSGTHYLADFKPIYIAASPVLPLREPCGDE